MYCEYGVWIIGGGDCCFYDLITFDKLLSPKGVGYEKRTMLQQKDMLAFEKLLIMKRKN